MKLCLDDNEFICLLIEFSVFFAPLYYLMILVLINYIFDSFNLYNFFRLLLITHRM